MPTATRGISVQEIYLPIAVKNDPCTFGFPDCFEENNSFDSAYGPIPVPGNLFGTADQLADPFDLFTTTLTSGAGYTVSLTVGRQDLDLYIYSDGPAYSTVASSAISGLGINEQIVLTPSVSAQYYILVYSYRSSGAGPYQLNIAQSTP